MLPRFATIKLRLACPPSSDNNVYPGHWHSEGTLIRDNMVLSPQFHGLSRKDGHNAGRPARASCRRNSTAS
jgi:hypothetical protein